MSTYDATNATSSYTPTDDDIAAYNEDQAKLEASELEDKPKSELTYKPVRQPITIHIGRHDNERAELVDACDVYCGVLAIRKLSKSRDFNITHIPTGLSIIDYVSPKAKAVECIMALLEDGAEIWKFGEFGKVEFGSKHHEAVKRVVDKAQHIAHPENWNEDGTRVR